MFSASNEEGETIHRALCVRHPNCNELHFCFNCSLVFCSDCRKIDLERVNHLKHSTEPLPNVLNQRKQQMTAIRMIIKDYIVKHDTTMEAMLKMQTEQKDQLEALNRRVDEFAAQLVAEVEQIKVEAKLTIAKRAAVIWSENSEVTRLKQIESELSEMRNIRAMIDHEVRLCDRYELYLIEKNKDIEKYANKLSDFKQKPLEIPDKCCLQLFELQRELLEHITRMQRELSSATDKFINGLQEVSPFPNPDQLSVVANFVAIFPKEKLLLPNEKDKSPSIKGVVPIDKTTDSLYIVTDDNPTIKQLDMKTSVLTEVIDSSTATINIRQLRHH